MTHGIDGEFGPRGEGAGPPSGGINGRPAEVTFKKAEGETEQLRNS